MKSKYWIILGAAMSLTQCIDVVSFQPPSPLF